MRRLTGLSKWGAVVLACLLALGVAREGAAQQIGVSAETGASAGSGEPTAGMADVNAETQAGGPEEGAGGGEPAEAQEGDPAPTMAASETEGVAGEVTRSADRAPEMDAGTYSVRLRDLEQRINELKEQIFRSKARLSLLAETVLQGVVAGAQAAIVHENRMGSSFRLVKAVYALDGAPIFNRADEEGVLGERDNFDVYNGSIVPGEHTLTVNLEYRGHGYGIFSYLKGYRFKVRSNYTFNAPEGKMATLRVVAYEKGGPTAPLEERPAIRYVERVSTIQAAPQVAAEGER